MLDPVPWAIGGGAEHSTEVLRTLAFAATGGAEGVAEPGDLKVSPLATPGASVRVATGAAVVVSRATGGAQQSYVVRNATETTVGIAATGSGSGRTDLVALIVKDPYVTGSPWTPPVDPAAGPYVEVVVIPNVAANVTKLQSVPGYAGDTGIALARVTVPASTSTITSAMLTDLREVAMKRTSSTALTAASTGAGKVSGSYVSPDPLDSATFTTWPDVASWSIDVPAWATRAVVTVQIFGAADRVADVWGKIRANLGGVLTGTSSYDVTYEGTPSRYSLGAAGVLSIPSGLRGTTQTLKVEGIREGGSGNLTAQEGTTTIVSVHFEEGVA